MKYVYSDTASKKLWEKATPADKKEAKRIYNLCKKSPKNKITLTVTRPKIVMNAIEVLFFPYDDFDGRNWYWIDGNEVEISVKTFNQLISRNTFVKNELTSIKKRLKLMKLQPKDRIRAIHDYICDSVEYSKSNKAKTTLYHAMVDKEIICSGYSKFMKALCDISGIVCDCVCGAVNHNREDHMWNRIMLDGVYYYIDATWDDYSDTEKYYMKKQDEFVKVHPIHTSIDKDIWMY